MDTRPSLYQDLVAFTLRVGRRLKQFGTLHVELLRHDESKGRSEFIKEIKTGLEESEALLERHYDLIGRSLDTVSHLSEHEDDKASRRLTAMAFLSTAATAFGAYALTSSAAGARHWFEHAGPFLLVLYYTCCAIGGFVSVYSMLPHYNIAPPRGDAPSSLVFAPMIERVSGAQWIKPFLENDGKQLREHVARQHLAEIKLIAQMTVWKMKMHWLAGGYFLSALLLFSAMLGFFFIEKMLPNPTPAPAAAAVAVSSVVIVFDGDNTLWDTDAVYRKAQLGLLADVEMLAGKSATGDRLEFVRRLDQALIDTHKTNRYPPLELAQKLFAALQPIAAGANPSVPDAETVGKLEVAVTNYTQRLVELPKVFPGTKEALERCVRENAKVIFLTENSLPRAEQLLDSLGLRSYFHRVQAERNKASAFRTIREETDASLGRTCSYFSVGDQRTADLVPAHAAGYKTVFIPGGFKMLQEDLKSFQPDFTFLTIGEFLAAFDRVVKAQP